ncbi:replication initiator [Streptomyces sp. NPDC002870]|uniref:replication initiator n=1 Tax=Streptomyces sp. NPDC002870 TaxID=3364666 RepID=UPI0036B7CE95
MSPAEWTELARFFERMTAPDYKDWEEGVRRIQGCAHPVHLSGSVRLVDSATGEVVHELGDDGRHRLMVPCGNRRKEWCAPCSRLYQWDTWHLVKAGLVGGKGVAESVSGHPRAFVTLTAPSFGPVHTVSPDRPCHPRRGDESCDHGHPLACWARHDSGDPLVGQPLCGGCYDYPGAVLWNAHAGPLWHRFTDVMRRQELPRAAGLTCAEFTRRIRVSFIKVAEYQQRGLIHFHGVVRLDPTDDAAPLPTWADFDLIDDGVRSSVPRVRLTTLEGSIGQWELGLGAQTDVQPIPSLVPPNEESNGRSTDHVAAYIAKYVTKAAECTGTVDRPLYCKRCKGSGFAGLCARCKGSGLRVDLGTLRMPQHARAMVGTAWRLGGLPEYRALNLRRWAHQFGYGGHFSTKSRRYSTTMTALRQTRADFRSEQTRQRLGISGELVTVSELVFAGIGYASETEETIAKRIRDDIAENRAIAREEIAALEVEDEWWGE